MEPAEHATHPQPTTTAVCVLCSGLGSGSQELVRYS